MNLVKKKVPPWSVKEIEAGIKKAQELFLSEGITAAKDPGANDVSLQAYRNLRERGELLMRIYMLYRVDSLKQTEEAVRRLSIGGDDILRIGGLKIFLDGSRMARTAWMHQEWNKNFIGRDEGNRGYPVIPIEEFREMVKIAHKSGLQIGVHAIGDRAVDEAVCAYQSAFDETPIKGTRQSLIHSIIPTEKALDKMGELYDNIVIETQSSFLYFIGDSYAGNFGPKRVKRVIPLRSYLSRKITVANSSDWPVCPFPPKFGLWAAVARRTWRRRYGTQPFGTEESITIHDALRTYTIMAAKCLFMEDRLGSIEKGKYADLTVWSGDLYTAPPDALKDLRVEMTIVGGRILYRS
jgi:predicted amidohydrolase YtcJ